MGSLCMRIHTEPRFTVSPEGHKLWIWRLVITEGSFSFFWVNTHADFYGAPDNGTLTNFNFYLWTWSCTGCFWTRSIIDEIALGWKKSVIYFLGLIQGRKFLRLSNLLERTVWSKHDIVLEHYGMCPHAQKLTNSVSVGYFANERDSALGDAHWINKNTCKGKK